MPFVRIDVPAEFSEDRIGRISAAVYAAMLETIDIPPNDLFQMIASPTRRFDRSFPDVARTGETVFIDVTLRRGRTADKKRAFYAATAQRLVETAGIARDDVFIVLHENEKIDWSFGGGIAQYEPAEAGEPPLGSPWTT